MSSKYLNMHLTRMGGQIFNLFILEILGTKVLFNLQLPLTQASHSFPAMPDGREGSSIAFL
jgi:hypothetical protein